MPLTASNLVTAINQLPKNRHYDYINPTTRTKILIESVTLPEGPITIKRYNPSLGKGPSSAQRQTISTAMIWRVANAINENLPINLDRVLGGSYNTRSALEALLANTPEFYYCFPGRIESNSSVHKIKRGHKHIIYKPNEPHVAGIIREANTELVISEIPTVSAVYESLVLPEPPADVEFDIDIERRHAQIQIAITLIGLQLGSKIWIARNDRGIKYKSTRLGEISGVINSLNDVQQIMAYQDAINAALLIDVIWFRNALYMPAVFEIEDTTGILPGLTRMNNFRTRIPAIPTRWVIVAKDDERNAVFRHATQPQFSDMNVKFMSYSAVEELYSLCQRRKIKGVNDQFLDSFMENCN